MKVGAFGRGPGKWRLDESTHRFRTELEAGKQPRIEDHLEQVEPSARLAVLRELLAVELRFRLNTGEAVKSDDYAGRFPELAGDDIEQIISGEAKKADPSDSDSPDGGTLRPGMAPDLALPAFHESWEDSHGIATSRALDTSLSFEDQSSQSDSAAGRDSGGVRSSSLPPLPPPPPAPLPISAPVAEPPRPVEIGRYQLIRTLGSGTYGEVLEAADPELDRHVALKLPRSGRKLSADAVARFRAEGRVLARLRHPGLVAVYDAGVTADGRPFVVSELVDGEDVSALLAREGKLKVDEAVRIVAEAAEALAAAHAAGVVHRDVKPANLMLNRDGDVRVADFGIALQDEHQETAKGEVLGSPAYMAPEQFTGEAHLLDGRADVWALGVVLYELLTGRRPFPAQSFEGLKEEVLKRDPRPLRQLNPKLPAWIDSVLVKCLAKKPSDRYSTAADLALDLRQGRAGAGERRRFRRAGLTFLAVVLLGSAAGALALDSLIGLPRPWTASDADADSAVNFTRDDARPDDNAIVDQRQTSPVEPPIEQWLPPSTVAASDELLNLGDGTNLVGPGRIIKTIVSHDGSEISVQFVLVTPTRRSDPPAFYIMETKVWNDLFRAFAEDRPEAVVDSHWQNGATAGSESLGVVDSAAMLPVVNVRLREAVEFAHWMGGRLPSSDQWDKAAGIHDHAPDAEGPFLKNQTNSLADIAVGRSETGPIPVGSSQDDISVFGMRDAAGNGWEFTRTPIFLSQLPPLSEWDATLQVKGRGRSYAQAHPLKFSELSEAPAAPPGAHHWTSFRVVLEQDE